MKLARFDAVSEQIKRNEAIKSVASLIAIYRFFEGKWFDSAGEASRDDLLLSVLNETRSLRQVSRSKDGFITYFFIEALDAVVALTTAASIRKPTKIKVQKYLEECVEVGTNAFKANYDPLTGLLNRDAFDRVLEEEVKRLARSSRAAANEVEKAEPHGAVAVVAFDIDFFKQVNDTFGHLYGDIVLLCLAQRVEKLCNDRRRSEDNRVRIYCARPSGEEFSILLAGAFSKEQESEFAELVRASIDKSALPDDAEWQRATNSSVPEGVELPHASERKLSISLGVYSVRRGVAASELSELPKVLKRRADVALYKAKKSGRNQVVSFLDILSKYGRIIEHDRDTDVVAIDIGHQVSVSVGQEFIVYDPKFSGGRPFVLDDGRTQKNIGAYPRVPCGRVEVFDVQSEVSFCRVIQCKPENGFAYGSALEAVPVGTIEHLIKPQGSGISAVASPSVLEGVVSEAVARNRIPSACAVALMNSDRLLEGYGTAYVNRVLARLFDVMQSVLPVGTKIGVTGRTQLVAVSPNRQLLDKDILEILSSVEAEFSGIPKLAAGIIIESDIANFERAEERTVIDPLGVLDLARLALLAIKEDGERLNHFTEFVPSAVINSSRSVRNVERALADYQLLVKLGARTASLENQLALTFYESGRSEEALEPIQRAVEMNEKELYYWLNSSLINFNIDNHHVAIDSYIHAEKVNPKIQLEPPYLENIALGFFRAYSLGIVLPMGREELRNLIDAALNHKEADLEDSMRIDLLDAADALEQASAG